jgi:hypothetical protein
MTERSNHATSSGSPKPVDMGTVPLCSLDSTIHFGRRKEIRNLSPPKSFAEDRPSAHIRAMYLKHGIVSNCRTERASGLPIVE